MGRNHWRDLTKKDREKIVLLTKQGIMKKYIAERFGITPDYVSKILREDSNI